MREASWWPRWRRATAWSSSRRLAPRRRRARRGGCWGKAEAIVVASRETGNSMVFEPQAGAEAPTRASGCLLEKGGKFLLAEQTTKVMLELQGGDLEKQLGNQVEISGRALPASHGAPSGSQLIKV